MMRIVKNFGKNQSNWKVTSKILLNLFELKQTKEKWNFFSFKEKKAIAYINKALWYFIF